MNKKSLGVIAGILFVAGGYYLSQPKEYMSQDISCDFDTGICVDKKGSKLNGKVLAYEGDVLISDIEYKNGKENGTVKLYRVNGKIYLEGVYSNGKPNGVIKEYDEEGNLFATNEFKDGVLNGHSVIYGKNNKIIKDWTFKDGKEAGVGRVYYENGNVNLEVDFTNGVLKSFYENGKENTVAHFNDKGYNGDWNIYSQDGELVAELKYENGKGIEGYCLEESGNKINLTDNDIEEFEKTSVLPCLK